MNQDPEDTAIAFLKYFCRQLVERDLMTRNEIWEAYYYAYDYYHNDLHREACRKPGYSPDKGELILGLVLMAGLDAFNAMDRNSGEWIENEVLIPIVGMHDHPL